jgi:UDP-N-acetylmuramyl pentapeptide phosphotransferase/UDP-N-acetylglucosamine-1-phosphate transferase
MFGFFKTLFFFGAIKKIKSSVFIIISSLILIAVSSSFFDDILSIPNDKPYFILSIKWAIILALIIVITMQVKKIISTNYLSIKKDKVLDGYNKEEKLNKKDKILKKDRLTSRSDIVIKKYKK